MTQGVIEIRGVNPQYNRYRYFIKNLMSLDYQLDSSVDAMPLPQANDERNVLTKTSGNSLRITIGWVVRDEPETMVLSNTVLDDAIGGSTGSEINELLETDESQKYPSGTIATADEQVRFLLEDFQNSGVEFRYAIIVGDTNITKMGAVERMSFRKSGSTPVTYQASLTFLVGDVVTVTGTS